MLRKSPREAKCERHALIIVAYGSMKDGKLFFVLQNSWGVTWGVNGYGRVVIDEPCSIFYLEKILKNQDWKIVIVVENTIGNNGRMNNMHIIYVHQFEIITKDNYIHEI